MIQIFASSNSRYFVLRHDNDISLYRVPARLWNRTIPGLQSVLGVSDRGYVYFRTINGGLCRYDSGRYSEIEKVGWENVLLSTSTGKARIDKTVLSLDGKEMFAEVTLPASSTATSTWKNLFTNSEGRSANSYIHIIYRIGDVGRKLYNLPRVATLSAHGEFFWNVSPEFTYCVMATMEKRGRYEFSVYCVRNKEVLSTFTMPNCIIRNLIIDDYGRTCIEADDSSGRRVLITRSMNGENNSVVLDPNAKVLHIWKDRVCWQTENELVIQLLNGKIVCRASTEPLNNLGVEYFFLFNRNNDINLALSHDSNLMINAIYPENLANDAKRWQRIQDMKVESEEIAIEEARKEKEKQESKQQHYQALSNKLGNSLSNIGSKRQAKNSDSSSIKKALTINLSGNSRVATEIAMSESMANSVGLRKSESEFDWRNASKEILGREVASNRYRSIATPVVPAVRVCSNCRTENSSESIFCRKCGNPLVLMCSSCGTEYHKGDMFCSKCGQVLNDIVCKKEREVFGYEGCKLGDTFTFGSFPQGNNGEDMPLEWRVIDSFDDCILAISTMGLNSRQYHHDNEPITWAKSDLRRWLNGEFYRKAFSRREQNCIVTTSIDNWDNGIYGTPGGLPTDDNVFLLSLDEAVTYFPEDVDRCCKPTDFAKSKGAYNKDGYCCWWLRSPGIDPMYAAGVGSKGDMSYGGHFVSDSDDCVRPVISLKI